jgi:uncharacterized membrane protein YjgN (DUF898 family)
MPTTITSSISPAVVLVVIIAIVTITIVAVPIAVNISARWQWRWQWEGQGQGNSAVFCCKALPGCIILIAVVDAPLSALALFLLLSLLPFPLPLLFPLPPLLRCCCFFRCHFELIDVCAPPNYCCRSCLCRRNCHYCSHCCRCHCCHHRCIAVVALAFVLCHPLVLLLCRLVVACCFASVAGIFVARSSFG